MSRISIGSWTSYQIYVSYADAGFNINLAAI